MMKKNYENVTRKTDTRGIRMNCLTSVIYFTFDWKKSEEDKTADKKVDI